MSFGFIWTVLRYAAVLLLGVAALLTAILHKPDKHEED